LKRPWLAWLYWERRAVGHEEVACDDRKLSLREVRYEAEGELTAMHHCHCSRCRKHSGAAFVTDGFVAASGFRWLSGEDCASRNECLGGPARGVLRHVRSSLGGHDERWPTSSRQRRTWMTIRGRGPSTTSTWARRRLVHDHRRPHAVCHAVEQEG